MFLCSIYKFPLGKWFICTNVCKQNVWVNRCFDIFVRIVTEDGCVQLKKKFPVKHKSMHVRSAFCPLMSFRQGACVGTYTETFIFPYYYYSPQLYKCKVHFYISEVSVLCSVIEVRVFFIVGMFDDFISGSSV